MVPRPTVATRRSAVFKDGSSTADSQTIWASDAGTEASSVYDQWLGYGWPIALFAQSQPYTKSETTATKPAFRDPPKFRRCLIPADGSMKAGRTENRRVEVNVLVNKGIAGS